MRGSLSVELDAFIVDREGSVAEIGEVVIYRSAAIERGIGDLKYWGTIDGQYRSICAYITPYEPFDEKHTSEQRILPSSLPSVPS